MQLVAELTDFVCDARRMELWGAAAVGCGREQEGRDWTTHPVLIKTMSADDDDDDDLK